jgi:hypothetical protein
MLSNRPSGSKREAALIHCRLDNLLLQVENFYGDDWPNYSPPSTNSMPEPLGDPGKPAAKRGKGRPKKAEPNRLKPYIRHFTFPRDVLRRYPALDDLVRGAAVADAGGNTRPFAKNKFVHLLQCLDEISTEAVQAEMNCSVRHAQKVAMCLRSIERHAFPLANGNWPIYAEENWHPVH